MSHSAHSLSLYMEPNYTLPYYIAELYPTLTHYPTKTNPN